MVKYLAHSARDGYPEQSYCDHIKNVINAAKKNAEAAAKYAHSDAELLIRSVYNAALYHDLGKLHTENQTVLSKANNSGTLPIHHTDAGVAYLKEQADSRYSQITVSSHHNGLPDIPKERIRKNNTDFRDESVDIRKKVDTELPDLLARHKEVIHNELLPSNIPASKKDDPVYLRIMLSCLADADHTDTAQHYGKYPMENNMPELRAQERLASLDRYVENLCSEQSSGDERNILRHQMYKACRNSDLHENIVACDSPVGSGKTTSVMAYLPQRAINTKARRIFVVLPFTNIIEQSVDVYRKALVLPGENPENVVAELHHRADFESENLRALSSNWKAPIIVTTAVAFFETLASNRPSVLRKLHELPGSVIFIDEAHAAVPVRLLPVTWRWMTAFSDEWSCCWVLASGSLVRFWNIDCLSADSRNVPQLIPDELREKLSLFEEHRIEYKFIKKRLAIDELLNRISSEPGPRLVIMNTVNNAAVVANKLCEKYGKDRVLHISTALKSEDRKATIEKAKEWLIDDARTDWTLVATSCVEAGVDFSFKTGFREVGSLLSLLQTAGRINRNGKYENATVWSFQMRETESLLNTNPALKNAGEILKNYFDYGTAISPELSTEAVSCELQRNTDPEKGNTLLNAEENRCFKEVCDKYNIIESDSVLVIVDDDMKQAILHGGCDWKDVQKKAVSVSHTLIAKYNLQELAESIYDWNLEYSPFLGIMQGVLNQSRQARK